MSKIGFVIVNYNDYKTTIELLKNIKNYNSIDLIVVVDNHSTDDSVKYLKKYENDKINIIENEENGGYAKGLNFGAKYVIKKLGHCNIVFSNSDIIIHKDEDIENLCSNIGKNSVALVGPTIVEEKGLNRGWMMPTIKDEIRFNLPLISRKYRKDIRYREEHYNEDLSIVGVVSGCIFAIDSNILKRIGFFDENTFLYYEEQILAKKLEEIDMQVAVDNNVVVIHNHSVTIDKNINKINKYKELKKSQRYFVKKYLEATDKELKRLEFTNKLSLVILYIRCFFKGGSKK